MLYRALADLVLVAHLGFVLFVMLGALLALRWPKILWVHLPAAAWGAFVEFSGRICPLTPLELWLRRQGGEAGYAGGFVEHYLLPLLYPPGLTTELQVTLGTAVVVANAALYGWLWRRFRKGKTALSVRGQP